MDIKFSVIIPVYNAQKYLKECVNSVLKQSYENFEIILIDDGSSDNSPGLCDYFAKKDSRIKAYHQQNQGPLLTRINGLDKAEGDFYLFLDSDDYWDKNLLETVCDTICKYNCDMVIFNYKKDLSDGVTIPNAILKDKTIIDKKNKGKLFRKVINTFDLNRLWNKAIKSNISDNTDYTRYKKVKHGEDLLQSLPLMYNAKRIVYIDKPLYNYRYNKTSITQTFDVNKFKDSVTVRNVVLEYLKKLKLDNTENLRKYYQFILIRLLKYIRDLVNAKIEKENKVKILSQIKNMPLYVTSFEYIDYSLLSLEERIRFYLFNKKYYFPLFIYEKSLAFIRRIRVKYLKNNKNKQLRKNKERKAA